MSERGGGRSGGRRTPLLRPGLHEGIELELEHHVMERTERLIDEGWEPAAARSEAERRFGVKRKWKNELAAGARAETGRGWMMEMLDSVMQDVRYALRGALREPGFTFTLLATLALGIGATGGVFSAIDAVMVRPLPYHRPDRLVEVQPVREGERVRGDFAPDQVAPWVEGAEFLVAVARHDRVNLLRTDGGAATLNAVVASANLDDVLGIEMALGRAFVDDDVAEDRRVAILTFDYWRRTGSDPAIVGTEIVLDEAPWTVVGVLDRGMKFPVTGTPELWIPYSADGTVQGTQRRDVAVVGRLADGLSLEAAQARADLLGSRLDEALPTEGGWGVQLRPVGWWRTNPDTARGLWLLGGGVLLMLVIAVVNAVNLLLVRGQGRTGEFGVRKALGASRGRVVRQVVVEAVLLSLAAGVVATAVAATCVEVVAWLAPREITFGMVHEFGLEWRSLALVFAVAAGAGLLVGVLPGLRLSRARVAGSGPAAARGRDMAAGRLRTALVTGEIAVSVVLLVGAGLFLRSFSNMLDVDMGMETERVAFATVDLPDNRYTSAAERAAFRTDALARLRAIPGVTSVASSTGAPPQGGGLSFPGALKGEAQAEPVVVPVIPNLEASPGFLETLGADLVAGRDLAPGDLETGGVVVDRDLAELLFDGGAAVNRRFTLDAQAETVRWLTVVGVVDELVLGGPDDHSGGAAFVSPMDPEAPSSWQVFTVRTSGDPGTLLAPVREVFHSLDDRLPLVALETGEQAFGASLTRPRFVVFLFSVLAWLALILSAVGIYGVVSFAVRQRRREMGIRIALGAPLASVRARIFKWGLAMAAVGTGVGVVVAVQIDQAAEALFFGVSPGDPATLAAVGALMLGVTGLACLIPAMRATRVDPVEALRSE